MSLKFLVFFIVNQLFTNANLNGINIESLICSNEVKDCGNGMYVTRNSLDNCEFNNCQVINNNCQQFQNLNFNNKFIYYLNCQDITNKQNIIDNEFIVILNKNQFKSQDENKTVLSVIAELKDKPNMYAKINNIYNYAIQGFSAQLNIDTVNNLLNNPKVALIEQDQNIRLPLEPSSNKLLKKNISKRHLIDQKNPIWNLDRIDQSSNLLNEIYNTGNLNGKGLSAYVLDTGINTAHPEFQNRIGTSKDFIKDGNGWRDCNGHGTHCAGTIGSKNWGVAKECILHSVRVLNCQGSGSTSGIIAGIDWVVSQAEPYKTVASLSLGGSKSIAFNTAVNNAVKNGVIMVVAAGNENKDACSTSPASSERAITVAATDINDVRSSFSNYGRCVDIFAPGTNIRSVDYTRPSGSKILSGTSMACPHVAGSVLLEIEKLGKISNPEEITNIILTRATQNKITNALSDNLLLRTPYGDNKPIPIDRCETISGGNIGSRCIFPFIFKGKTYNGCTTNRDPNNLLWCSTKVDNNNRHIVGEGNWGHCNDKCPINIPVTENPTLKPTFNPTLKPILKPTLNPTLNPIIRPDPDKNLDPCLIADAINKYRIDNGLSVLKTNSKLFRASLLHAQDMANNNYFSHIGLDGSTPSDRANRETYPLNYLSENIAAGYNTVENLVNGWLNSQGHLANIRCTRCNDIGVGLYVSSKSKYKTYFVTLFGYSESLQMVNVCNPILVPTKTPTNKLPRPTPPFTRPTPPFTRPTPPFTRPTPPFTRPTPPFTRPTPPFTRPTLLLLLLEKNVIRLVDRNQIVNVVFLLSILVKLIIVVLKIRIIRRGVVLRLTKIIII